MTKTLCLYQPLNGYCYNSDTHFLYNFICKNLEQFKNIKGELLDIGSGSGILGLLVARDYDRLNLNQVEIQKSFQFLSQKNSEVNGIQNNMYHGSVLDIEINKQFTKESKAFDYIISNPPFYNNDVIKSENESLKIARYNDNFPLDKFISKASKLLSPKGKFFFCYDVKQIHNIIVELNNAKLNIEAIQFLHPKPSKEASLVMVYARKSSKSKLKVINPLIMFDENGEFTQEVNDIYTKCSTHSIKCEVENRV
ncbi:MAG: methyltransferase [Campylobacterota bacterium]|nr:methyltransferase [Campylobacterota bacterium]